MRLNLKVEAWMVSSMAKGLKDEYIMIGEKMRAKMKIKPGGPMSNLYQGPFPKGFILNISD